jgi:hypothetical protein
MKERRTYRWLRVDNPRNSTCASWRLGRLDWSEWWTDRLAAPLYLHVAGPDDTSHRVFPRERLGAVRLGMKAGRLYWIAEGR